MHIQPQLWFHATAHHQQGYAQKRVQQSGKKHCKTQAVSSTRRRSWSRCGTLDGVGLQGLSQVHCLYEGSTRNSQLQEPRRLHRLAQVLAPSVSVAFGLPLICSCPANMTCSHRCWWVLLMLDLLARRQPRPGSGFSLGAADFSKVVKFIQTKVWQLLGPSRGS